MYTTPLCASSRRSLVLHSPCVCIQALLGSLLSGDEDARNGDCARPIEPEEAVSTIRSGDTVMVGGFGLVGAPLTLIDALVESSDADELTIVSNNIGEPGRGLGKLLRQGRIKRGISSYFTSNPEAVAAVNAARSRPRSCRGGRSPRPSARRAPGSPASSRRSARGRCSRRAENVVDGVPRARAPDPRGRRARLRAARGDELGNLWYRRTARNFNPLMATAARVTIAEVGEVVAAGVLEPESIRTPHLYVRTGELVLAMTGDVRTSIAAVAPRRNSGPARSSTSASASQPHSRVAPFPGTRTSFCIRRTGFSGSGRGPARTSSTRTSSTRRSSP